MILGATGVWADEITATLDHTAGAQWGSNTGASTVDAEKEHYNNDAATAWAGCAYAKFSYTIPEGHSITKAQLTYSVNQGGRSGRDDIIYYMKKDFDLDWATFAGQTGLDLRNASNRADKAVAAASTGGTGDRLNLSQDVTDAVKAIFNEGQNYIIFQWTGNAGGADLYGKASANAPTLVITTADASSVTSYTVKFTDGTNELKDAAVYTNVAIGSEQTASSADIASFVVGDKKYIYVSGNSTITTVADAATNVITLVFREAATYNYTVKSSLGTTIFEGTGFESDAITYYFPQYLLSEGVLHNTPANNKEYRNTTTLDTDNKVITVNYSATETNDIVFLKEAEDIEGATASAASNADIRCSMGKGAFFANDAVVTTLQPGKYKLTAQVWGNATTTFVIKAGEATVLSIDTKGYIYSETSEEFELTKVTDITIPAVGNENRVLDLVYIQKTGDVEVADPNNYTSYIVNADLSDSQSTAWNTEGTKGYHSVGGVVTVGNNGVFDFKQTIAILPAGKYKVTAQAAYRYGDSEQAEYDAIVTSTETKFAKLYATVGTKTVEALVQNRWEGASETNFYTEDASKVSTVNEKFVPNSTAAVKAWFTAGKYVNELEFNIPEDGAVTIGIVKTAQPGTDFTVIGPWTLTRLGDAEVEPEPVELNKVEKTVAMSEEITNVEDLTTNKFMLQHAEDGLLLCALDAVGNYWDINAPSLAIAIANPKNGAFYQLVAVDNHYQMEMYNVNGERRKFWAGDSYVNAQPGGNVIFGLGGTAPDYGQDGKNLALWDVTYTEGQGFAFHCVGRDIYLGEDGTEARPSADIFYWKAYKGYVTSYNKEELDAAYELALSVVKTTETKTALENAKAAYDTDEDINAFGDAVNAAIDVIKACEALHEAYAHLDEAGAAVAAEVLNKYNAGEFANTAELQAAYIKAVKAQNTIGADFTLAIVNPSFEKGNIDGWVSNDGGNAVNNGNFGAATGSFFVEKWTASSGKLSDGSLLQTINELPAGKYKVTAEMQNREQGNSDAAGTGFFLVAGKAKTEAVTADGKTFEVIGATTLGTLEIGTKLENCSGNWVCVDNFTMTLVEAFTPEYVAAEKALADAITEAKALDTTGKEGVDGLTAGIKAAEDALNTAEPTVESFTNAKTALEEVVAAYILANTKVLTLKAPVGEEVSLTIGVWNTEDTFTVDFGGEDNVQTAKVGIDNKGPVKEDGTTASTTKFTGTVGGDGTIKVSGVNDIWYFLTTGGAMPTTFDQELLMNVVQMSITGADVESVALPAYPKMTQFSFNNSSAKSVDVTKVTTLTSLTINNTTASKYEAQLESIDLSQNTELAYLSLQGNTKVSGKLKTLDLTNNTKLDGMGLYVQYNALTEIKLGENTLSAINVQNNQLTSLDWTKLTGLKNIYASNNKLAGEVDLSANAKFENVQLNNNELTSVKLPEVTKQLAIQDNKFTLATLPAQPASLNTTSKTKKFTYAPQAAMQVAETVSELDLTSQLTVAQGELNPEAVGEAAAYTTWIENQTTTFSFVTTGGTALVEGTDYEVVEPGKFKFLKAQEEKVHAVMLNAAFPKFTEAAPFTTTEFTVEAAEEFDGVKVTYALKEGETHASGDVVEVKNEDEVVATITYGEAGGAEFKAAKANTAVEGFEAFTEGNGQNGNKEGGTFYTIVPKFDGKIDFAVVLNADKAFYILEDGTALSDFDGITVSEKTYGTITFDVKAGKAYKVYAAGTKLGFYGFNYTYKKAEQPAATELELTLNVERYPGLGYSATEATVDFTEAKAFLGVETITTDMLSIVNPDNTTISDYATYDGWFNGEGAAETWGSNTKVCVKFFQAIAGEGKYEICDMNGADEVGKTYSVKWQLAANDKKVIYTINVTFVEKPVITLTFADLNKKDEQTVALTSELGKCYEGLTADVDVAAILAKLEVSSLNDVTIYAVQSDGSLDDNYKLGTTDGWRNAAGDWQGWGNDAYFFVKADFAKESAQIYEAGGMDGKNTTADWENPASYTATYAFVKTGTTDAVVLKVTLTYTIPTGINAIATDAQKGVIYNMNGQKVNKAKKGLFIINGKKTVIK